MDTSKTDHSFDKLYVSIPAITMSIQQVKGGREVKQELIKLFLTNYWGWFVQDFNMKLIVTPQDLAYLGPKNWKNADEMRTFM